MKAVVVAVLSITACDSPSTATDAGADDAIVDAPPAGRCDPTKPFGRPQLIAELRTDSSSYYNGSWLTSDELTIYFARLVGEPSSVGIFRSTRPDHTTAWGTPAKVAEYAEGPTLTADELTMYASLGEDIVVATRASTADTFGAFAVVPELSTAGSDRSPSVLPDHSAIYVSSAATNTDPPQIFRSSRDNGTFSAPTLVPGLGSPSFAKAHVAVASDEMSVYFSDPDDTYEPLYEVWFATRNSRTDEYANRTKAIDSVGTSPDWISVDTCVIYLTHSIDPRHGGVTMLTVAAKPH